MDSVLGSGTGLAERSTDEALKFLGHCSLFDTYVYMHPGTSLPGAGMRIRGFPRLLWCCSYVMVYVGMGRRGNSSWDRIFRLCITGGGSKLGVRTRIELDLDRTVSPWSPSPVVSFVRALSPGPL